MSSHQSFTYGRQYSSGPLGKSYENIWRLEYISPRRWRIDLKEHDSKHWIRKFDGDLNDLNKWLKTRHPIVIKSLFRGQMNMNLSGSWLSRLLKIRPMLKVIGEGQGFVSGTTNDETYDLLWLGELDDHGGVTVWRVETRPFYSYRDIQCVGWGLKTDDQIDECVPCAELESSYLDSAVVDELLEELELGLIECVFER